MVTVIRVLYVDDEPGLLGIGKLFLEKEGGFTVDTLTSATVALEQLNTERYDAIISDYQMPDMDGITFLKQLKTSGNTTPFIIFTGRGREEVVIEALNEGADFYLQKGGEPKAQFTELAHKIRSAVNRKKTENALRESELFLKETQQIARLGGWKANPHTDYLEWTDGIYDIIEAPRNYRPGLIEGMKYYAPEDVQVIREKMAACLSSGEPFAIEVRIITETGKKIWTELRGLAPVIEGGRSYVLGTLQDIATRKVAEDELSASYEQISAAEEELRGQFDMLLQNEKDLRESEARYRLISENTADVIWTLDIKTGKFTYVSPSVQKLRGYSPDEVMTQTMAEALTPESMEAVARLLQDGIYGRKPGDTSRHISTNLVDQPCKDGSVVSTEVVSTV
ncbi:MAG: response regulator, partial [Methanomicrobiales archaeon]